jgi:hypothetical protein
MDLAGFLLWLEQQGYEVCRWEKSREHPLVGKRHWDLITTCKEDREELVRRYCEQAGS